MANLTEKTKADIQASFDYHLDKELESCASQYDYADYGDTQAICSSSYKESDIDNAKDIVIRNFEDDFERFNNSWIDPESVNYEQEKELVIDFVRGL
jgi:hypothetical protein